MNEKDWWRERLVRMLTSAGTEDGTVLSPRSWLEPMVGHFIAEAVARRDAEILEMVEGMKGITRDLETTYKNRALDAVARAVRGDKK